MDIATSTLAFRGYNTENLGRTPDLLEVPEYRTVLVPLLDEASEVCGEITGRRVNLVERVESRVETTLEDYAESIALIVAVELSHLKILHECHDIDYHDAKMAFGFSLGEISALVAGGTFALRDALQIPISMASDGVELARDVTLGVLFCRRDVLEITKVHQILLEINTLGNGVIAISTQLGPNSVLVMGTGETIELLKGRLGDIAPKGVHLKCNKHRWPPLHTPIVWEKNINSRAGRMLHTLPGGFKKPHPEVLSLVTGKKSYDDFNAREHMIQWIDHPQQLWDAVYEILASGTKTVIHVGPAPNIVPATLDRLATNVESQTKGSRRMKALSTVINRPWLKNILPRRAALLRAPRIEQIVLEDWLMEHAPSSQAAEAELAGVPGE